jgi:hypothetical protein
MQISRRIGHNDPENAPFAKTAVTTREKTRDFLRVIQVFQKMFAADSDYRSPAKRQRLPAVIPKGDSRDFH